MLTHPYQALVSPLSVTLEISISGKESKLENHYLAVELSGRGGIQQTIKFGYKFKVTDKNNVFQV